MKRRLAGLAVLMAAAFGGAIASVLLLVHHVQVRAIVATNGTCGGGPFDCSAVAMSDWSELFGIPMPALGVAWFATLFLLAVAAPDIRRHTDADDLPASDDASPPPPVPVPELLVALFGAGVLASIALALISAFAVGAFCPWCVAVYGCNIVGLVGAALYAGHGLRQVPGRLGHARRPLLRWWPLWAAPGVAAGLIALASLVVVPLLADRIDGSKELAAALHGMVTTRNVHADHAPAIGPADAPVQIVLFSDFACPYCSKLARELIPLVRSRSDVRLEFRHYYIDGHQRMSRPAALAAIAAQEQGKFWEMHDLLHRFGAGNEQRLRESARAANLDVERFLADIGREATAARLEADMAAAEELLIVAAPTMFVNQRRYIGADVVDRLLDLIQQARLSTGRTQPAGASDGDGAR